MNLVSTRISWYYPAVSIESLACHLSSHLFCQPLESLGESGVPPGLSSAGQCASSKSSVTWSGFLLCGRGSRTQKIIESRPSERLFVKTPSGRTSGKASQTSRAAGGPALTSIPPSQLPRDSQWVVLFATRERAVAPSSVSSRLPRCSLSTSKIELLCVSRNFDISNHVFTTAANTRLNKAPAKFRTLDYAERHGYVRGIVKDIIHDPGQSNLPREREKAGRPTRETGIHGSKGSVANEGIACLRVYRSWCSSRQGPVPPPLQVQAGHRDLHRQRGHVHRPVHLRRQARCSDRRQRPARR